MSLPVKKIDFIVLKINIFYKDIFKIKHLLHIQTFFHSNKNRK